MVNLIHILPNNLVNKIAAGEVIERPSSVVKELVENSIDASSAEISVFIKDGGKRSIKVVDNGIGMSESDALLSLERHATSKINEEKDLDHISTLGFRGEALPSIASVSQLTLKTRTKNYESGTKIDADGGKIISVSKTGISEGTEIEVRNIFYNTPARLKFLKSATTELNNINDTIVRLSLSNTLISFCFSHNDREMINLQKSENIITRIKFIFGNEFSENLLQIKSEDETTVLEGYISKPDLLRNSRTDQYIFVNGRSIKDRTIFHAIMEGYKSIIPREQYPSVFLFLKIEPSQIDVNTHPAKVEIKFAKPQKIHSLISKTISETLDKNRLVKSFVSRKEFIAPKEYPEFISFDKESDLFQKITFDKQNNNVSEILNKYFPVEPKEYLRTEESKNGYNNSNLLPYISLLDLRILGQIKNSFIIAESSDSLVFVDQHAAHERILYFNLKKQVLENSLEVKPLLFPLTIDTSFRDKHLINEHKKNLLACGFEVEEFGANTIIIKSIPSLLDEKYAKSAILALIDDLSSYSRKENMRVFEDSILKSIACHSAVKANQKLEIDEMKFLLKEMERIKFSDFCPHGRPAIFELKITEIEKRFLRR